MFLFVTSLNTIVLWGVRKSGVYQIFVTGRLIDIYCDMEKGKQTDMAQDTLFDKLLIHVLSTTELWKFICTVWCNQMGTVFAEMSSWKAFTWNTLQWWRWHLRPKIWKVNFVESLLWTFYILRAIKEYAWLKK